MSETTLDADEWWAQPECRTALADRRWDRVLAIAMHANGWDQRDIAAAVGRSQSYVSRILNGERNPRTVETLSALCSGLGIPRHLAGLADAEEVTATDRRQVLAAAGGVLAAGLVGAGASGGNLADLGGPTQTYRRAEATTSSRLLRAPAGAHLNFLRALAAQATDSPADATRLQVLIGEAAGFAAWLARDCDEPGAARQLYTLAVQAANATRKPLLVMYMMGSLAQAVSATGDHTNAAALMSRARAGLTRSAPAIARVWADCNEATIAAAAGEERALSLLDAAQRAQTSAEPVWPWLHPFDAAKLDSYRQLAMVRLRRRPGEWSAAAHPSREPQPKIAASRLMERAEALVDLDQPEQACAVAAVVWDVGRQYGSEALTRKVIDLRARVHVGGREVDNLDARLSTLYDV